MLKLRSWAIVLAVAGCAASIAQASEPDPAGVEFFEKRIRPLLVDQCYECHSTAAKKVKGRLLLDSRAGVLHGGEGGAIIEPGNPAKSRLISAIKYDDPDLEMPPKHQLSAEQVAAFEQWIQMGAPDPREAVAKKKPEASPTTQPATTQPAARTAAIVTQEQADAKEEFPLHPPFAPRDVIPPVMPSRPVRVFRPKTRFNVMQCNLS